tara:strand:+ start:468 stop:746 length:279 start_codon:yes stop_codon:yes gene_type:complete
MDKPRIKVDFNELMEPDLVLIAQTDERTNSEGNKIKIFSGAFVYLYEYNKYDDGEEEYFFAEGVVELNDKLMNKHAKWSCRINEKGIVAKYT